jgi:pilus assembly protein Flp/PilA
MVRSFFAREEGQGLVEYALILVLIAIVVIGILTLLGSRVSQVFSQINSGLTASNVGSFPSVAAPLNTQGGGFVVGSGLPSTPIERWSYQIWYSRHRAHGD